MKNLIIICSALFFFGAIIKILFLSIKKEKYVYITNTVIGVSVLIVIINYFSGQDFKIPEFSNYDTDYSHFSQKYMRELLDSSEQEVEQQISNSINNRFGIKPYKCDIIINENDFTVEKAEIIFKQSDGMISNYEIYSYVEGEFEIKAEVKFI